MTKSLQATHEKTDRDQLEGEKRLLQAYEIYNNLTSERIEDFNKVKQYVSQILERLFQEGKIERGATILSRIKSPSSVVKNWKLGKKLDDIFGITLLTVKPEEIDIIRSEIRNQGEFDIISRKERNEKRGYEAIHFSFEVGNNKKTKVECHLQTHQAYLNVYPHIYYKVRREFERELTSEEESIISAKIQNMYENGRLGGYKLSGNKKSRIPQMWVASFNPDGKMEEQQLDENVILTIMYPFLDISKKKDTSSSASKTEKEEIEL